MVDLQGMYICSTQSVAPSTVSRVKSFARFLTLDRSLLRKAQALRPSNVLLSPHLHINPGKERDQRFKLDCDIKVFASPGHPLSILLRLVDQFT